jgi:hypothetical protein
MRVFLRPFELLICCMLFAAGLNAQSMVANYSFAGNANDVSATANHASVHGAVLAADRFGWANNAFSFDGEQGYLEAPNTAALNSDYTTVAFWINANEIPATGEVYPLSFGGWQQRWKISLPNHGKLIWTTNNSSGISDMDSGDGNELVPGAWTHVVMVHDGTKDLIYMNGALANEKDVEGTMNATDKVLGIGYNPIDADNFFNGYLDEVQVYDYALSAVEIETLYNTQATEPVIPNAIVASYSFSGSGLDDSGFGNHGLSADIQMATDRFGFGNAAYHFNGTSSSFTAPNSAQLNSDYTTIGFWVKVNSLPASGEAYLMSHGGWQDRWKISLPSHGKPVFTTNATAISDMDSGDGNELVPGVWTHVAMVHDGTKNKIYMNGAPVAEKDVEGALNTTEHPLGIGYNPIDNANYFDGVFDEVQIINYALSDFEIAAAFGLQSTFPGDPDDNLVAAYHFSGNTNDDSQFGNHAVNNGAIPAMDRFGLASNAMEFTGTESVMAVNSTALNSDNITISFWVNVTELPASGEAYLLSNGGWQERWKISLPSHGKPVFTTHPGFCCSDMDSGTPLVAGEWTHVVMTHDGTKDIIYFDGAQVAEKDVEGALDNTGHALGIGYNPIDNGNFFNGKLDDIQLYNEALTAQEVSDLYDEQSVPPVIADELVAYYPFSGNANDVTPITITLKYLVLSWLTIVLI